MAKKSYVGNPQGYARLIPDKGYIGNEHGYSRKLLKGYIGNEDGESRQFWPSVIKVTKAIFSKYISFNIPGNVVSINAVSNWSAQKVYAYYAYGGYGTFAYNIGPFTCLSCLDIQDYINFWFNRNPVNITWDYSSQGIQEWYINIPGGNDDWWLSIPTLLFGVSHISFVLDGFSTLTNVYIGVATRQDDERWTEPTVFYKGERIDTGTNVVVEMDLADVRADFIYIHAANVVNFTTRIKIREINVTYERCYGIVNSEGITYYVHFPRFGLWYYSLDSEPAVIEALGAVYMLLFDTDNTYSGDDFYVEQTPEGTGEFGTGDTYVLFISKNTFTVKKDLADLVNNYGNYTTESVTYQTKTTYYVLIKYQNLRQNRFRPYYSHAYTHYGGWASNPAAAIGKMGKDILYDGNIS